MNKKLELFASITLLALPFAMIAYYWNTLPDEIPVHWNASGEIDRWGSRNYIFLMPIINIGTYLLLVVIPYIDPKNRIKESGNFYYMLRFTLVGIFFGFFTFILYATLGYIESTNWIIYLLLAMFMILGNLMAKVKPNYFIGVRTPWTLENEEVWRKTHRFTGFVWVFGSILVLPITFIVPQQHWVYLIIPYLVLVTAVPLIYSFVSYTQHKKSKDTEAS